MEADFLLLILQPDGCNKLLLKISNVEVIYHVKDSSSMLWPVGWDDKGKS